LPPDAAPPDKSEEGATELDERVLEDFALEVSTDLRARLDPECLHLLPEPLVDFVCVRPAEIVADPGWIEVRLPLDSVSTELRRAALDLDPGYLPWLGLVVKFVYE
jgi:hypothetical protein